VAWQPDNDELEMIEILRDYGILLLVGQFPTGPIGGLALTLCLAVAGLVLSFPLAVVMGVMLTGPNKIARAIANIFVFAVRGLPVLLLIFWAYFVVPLIVGHPITGITTLVCALVVYEIAFLGEVIKAGIMALPSGQTEASRSLGLSYAQTLRDIVLPQALYNMIPSILNQFVNLIKNTSLGYIISVEEFTYSAYQVNSQLLVKPFQVYMLTACVYFVLCFSLSSVINRLENRIHLSRQGTTSPT
jgi:polar amino acid transport system permease protein